MKDLKLHQPSQIPGGWTEREVAIDDCRFNLLVPANPDGYLESVEDLEPTERDTFDPYWANLWPASIPTAKAVLRANWQSGQQALELGCGVGLVGLAALASGLPVTFSDYQQTALDAALENARRNGLAQMAQVEGMLLDWRRPPDRKFALLLASDVLYEHSLHDPLLNTIGAMLAEGGACWIGDPGRSVAASFLHMAADRGFSLRLYDEDGGEVSFMSPGRYARIVLRRVQV